MTLLTHDQFQYPVGGNRGNRILAHGQRHQGIHQCLSVQAHQVSAIARQLAAGQRLFQGLRQAIELHLGVAGDTQPVQEVLNRPRAIAWQHFHQVAGQPAAGVGWGQAQ
ncbi:hypothetical protein D3C78_806550 [compost metagenome]